MPTKAIAKPTLLQKTIIFLRKLKQLDLGPIAYQLMHPEKGCGWAKGDTIQAISRYKLFLLLAHLYPERKLVPTPEIDQVWHHHILDTVKYLEDCQFLFGYILHHFPYSGLQTRSARQEQDQNFLHTQQLFKQHFGLPMNNEQPSLIEGCSIPTYGCNIISQLQQPAISGCIINNQAVPREGCDIPGNQKDLERPQVVLNEDPFAVLGVNANALELDKSIL